MYFYLLVATLIANFADSLFGPLYAIYVQNIGGDILDVGNTMALSSIATGFLIIVFGKLSDHGRKELYVTLGLSISALGTLGYIFISTPFQLYLLQLVFALSTALLSAPFSALFAEHIDKNKAGLLWALEGGGSKIIFGLGLLLGTFITYRFGFVTVFIIVFSFQICAALLLGRTLFLPQKKTVQ
ncbi:MAG: Inner membrane transport protein ydhC [Parcubacteria group bacterium GW2011_GWA2_43_11]|nr:MAG: Inner membrane transport protein ydhC [Parcubacteria group bacterium GW2011_GWC2_42_11]KKS84666.1 MAG: Inner membrane transport protein ydhC [Parcubacteria group bacterium GW2011_GWA2_43_11]